MIFKIHYGLWYGALVGIIPFMFNYAAEYSGATGTQHGILYTILPFIALLAKPIICSMADKYAVHHHVLLFFIFTTIVGYGSLAIYPFFPTLIQDHKQIVWILYCTAALIGNTSMCIVNSIGDSLAINSCQKKDISYGEYRLWGPVGFGIFGAIWGIANEIPSMPKYTPGIITLVLILILNSLIIAFWYDKEEFKVVKRVLSTHPTETAGALSNYGSTQIEYRLEAGDATTIEVAQPAPRPKISRWTLLLRLGRQESSIYGYLFLFTFCGVMTAVHWQFFFRYLEKVATSNKFSTIATLALPVQALGGELVFFMLANKIVQKLGASLALVVSLLSFASRYLLYAYVIPNISIYWILLVELFQGPAFGLMYCVLTHQANYYSEKIDQIVSESLENGDVKFKNSLHATLQGLLGASFEGLGLGLGAIIGGLAYDFTPILMWQIAGFSALAVSILCLLVALINSMKNSPDNGTRCDSSGSSPVNGEGGESHIIEELRKIAMNCQQLPAPSISDIRAQLEQLAYKAEASPTAESSH